MTIYHIAKPSDRSPTGSVFVSDVIQQKPGEPIGLLTTYFPIEAQIFTTLCDAAGVYWKVKQQFPKYEITEAN